MHPNQQGASAAGQQPSGPVFACSITSLVGGRKLMSGTVRKSGSSLPPVVFTGDGAAGACRRVAWAFFFMILIIDDRCCKETHKKNIVSYAPRRCFMLPNLRLLPPRFLIGTAVRLWCEKMPPHRVSESSVVAYRLQTHAK